MAESTTAQKETEATPVVQMKNLMTLGEQEKIALREILEATRGIAQLWVHTHTDPQFDRFKLLEEYQKGIGHVITDSSPRMPVIALIEAFPSTDPNDIELDYYTRRYAGTKSPIYYVRTYPTDATPALDADPQSPEKEKENWDTFTQRLKEIGVKSVVVSGRNFWNKEDPDERGCVGFATHELKKRGIASFQSKITFPEQKKF